MVVWLAGKFFFFFSKKRINFFMVSENQKGTTQRLFFFFLCVCVRARALIKTQCSMIRGFRV